MKKNLLMQILVLLSLTAYAFSENPPTFEEYKKLSQGDRQKITGEATPELHKQYNRWNQIINMGGNWWEPTHQGWAFIRSKGFTELAGLSIWQTNLFGDFELAILESNKKSGMSEKAQDVAAASLEAEYKLIDKERYKDQWWYLVKLAPTPEAMALNEKAAALGREWITRYQSTSHSVKITRDDIKAINAAVKEIRDQMRELPQLTPEQIEVGLAALPDDQ
jgi:hypothetical protein